MNYTKGKWEVASPKHPDIRQTEDRLIYVRVGDKKLHIAEVYQYQNHNNREANGTAIANARLIAAAPQLLEACKEGLRLAEILNHPDEYHIKQAIEAAEKNEQGGK